MSAAATPAAPPQGGSPPKARGGGRLQELDGLRALMVLVVLFHAYQASTGDISVHVIRDTSVPGVLLGNVDILLSIFFLLSGFAVYYQFAGRMLRGRPLPAARSWLWQRALRLLPIYYVVFLVVWFWRYGGGEMQWMDLIWGLSLLQTWSTDHIFRTIDPGWYLSVEWHFAVFTAVAVIPWLRRVSGWPMRSRLAGMLLPPLALIALTVWWRTSLVAAEVPMDRWGAWFAPPSWGLMYGTGMLFGLALTLRTPDRWSLPRPAPALLFAAATAWLIYVQTMRGANETFSIWYFDLGVLGTLGWFVAVITAPPDGRMRRLLSARPVQALAAASYATYIIHAPILRSLAARDVLPMNAPEIWPYSAVAIVILAFSAGLLAHRYIELPLASIGKLAEPKFLRATRIAKVFPPKIAPGARLPEVEVFDDHGVAYRLDKIAGGQPLLLLVLPTGILPRHPMLQGQPVAALRALDSLRPAAAAQDLAVAAIAPTPIRRRTGDDEGVLAPMPLLIDPACGIARAIGVGVLRTEEGRHLPEIVLLVVDRTGTVRAVVRDSAAERLVQQGIAEAGVIPGLSRRRPDRPDGPERRRSAAPAVV